MLITNDYIVQFWVGLMDGDGSIQVNHWRKRCLQFRFIIKLSKNLENISMLERIQKTLGGCVRSEKDYVLWVENKKKYIIYLLGLLKKYPPLTTRLQCQINFTLLCLEKNDVNWYLDNRHLKYSKSFISKTTLSQFYDLSFYDNIYWFIEGSLESSHLGLSGSRSVRKKKELHKSEVRSSRNLCELTYFKPWFSGFIEGSGCFCVRQNGEISFSIGHSSDFFLLENILYYLQASQIQIQRKKNDCHEVHIYRKQCLHRLVSHLSSAPLLGYKDVQFLKFLLHLNK